MQKKTLLLTAVIAAALVSIACDCKWFDTEKQIQTLFEKSDYVFVGQPIRALNPAEKVGKEVLGYDILMKVQALKKGRMTTDTVVVVQEDDNCARRFTLRDTLVVFGSQVEEFRQVSPDSQKPYSGFADDGKTFLIYRDNKMFTRYQKARKHYPVVVTNQCISFTLRHLPVARFIQAQADAPFSALENRRPGRR